MCWSIVSSLFLISILFSSAYELSTVDQCVVNHLSTTLTNHRNSQTSIRPIIIRNTSVWTGERSIITDSDILLENKKIQYIGKGIPIDAHAQIIDGSSLSVTPGLIDSHSHMGMWSIPVFNGNSDYAETGVAAHPQGRAIDAFNPKDWSIPRVRSGGVTSTLILTSSFTNIGGEGVAIKLRKSMHLEDFLIHNSRPFLKMACGENAIRAFGRGHLLPNSRLGELYLFKSMFLAAEKLLQQQRSWCTKPDPDSQFPKDHSLHSLVALLLGEYDLHVHCYRTFEMENMIRLSQRFNFRIKAFHHATEAYLISSRLRKFNISVALFADSIGTYKWEAKGSNPHAPSVLKKEGVVYSIKSDHPIVNSGRLMFEAAKTVHYGMDVQSALQSITSHAAFIAGLSDRVGSVRVGMDADLIVWNTDDPFQLGAHPKYVIIEGEIVEETKVPLLKKIPTHLRSEHMHLLPRLLNDNNLCLQNAKVVNSVSCYFVQNVSIWFSSTDVNPHHHQNILIREGVYQCIGVECAVPDSECQVFYHDSNDTHFVAVPGFFDSWSDIGLININTEPTFNDGEFIADFGNQSRMNGVRLGSEQVLATMSSGLTTFLSKSKAASRMFLGGVGIFYGCCMDTLLPDFIISTRSGFAVRIGKSRVSIDVKKGTGRVSEQFAILKQLLQFDNSSSLGPNKIDVGPIPGSFLRDREPLIVEISDPAHLLPLLRLRDEFKFRLVVVALTDISEVVEAIHSSEGVSFVLQPSYFMLDSLQLPKVPLYSHCSTIEILESKGILWSLAPIEKDYARQIRWEMGICHSLGLPFNRALAGLTTNPATMFDVPEIAEMRIGRQANFVVFNENPFHLSSKLQFIGVKQSVKCMS